MTNINPVSNFVSGASGAGVVSVDIDALRQLADALKRYAVDDMEPAMQALNQDRNDLSNHWQGSAAHQAYEELSELVQLAEHLYLLASELSQRLNEEIFAYLEASGSLYTG